MDKSTINEKMVEFDKYVDTSLAKHIPHATGTPGSASYKADKIEIYGMQLISFLYDLKNKSNELMSAYNKTDVDTLKAHFDKSILLAGSKFRATYNH